ncbi:MAG: permease prefix domain 1-containing protein [Eubacteriaceae bacterium]
MTNKIHSYIENAFSNVPSTKKIQELKDELYANLVDKYNDQLAGGKSETESYNIAISSIGDIEELVDSVRSQSPLEPTSQADRKRSAIFVSVAVMMYILSPFVLILFSTLLGAEIIGLLLMFVFIAGATGLLIYNNMTKPVYQRADETLVEEFKEWKGQSNQKKAALRSFKSGFWGIIVVIYLMMGFVFHMWAYSWLIFIAGAAIINIIEGVLHLKEDSNE